MKKVSQRNYNMTDYELTMFTSNLVVFMTRDSTEFAAKGVNALAITALGALGNAFEIFPNDDYYKADVSLAVDHKDTYRESLEIQIRAIIGCAKIKWGGNSPQVKRFGAKSMTQDTDKKFLTICRQVVVVATDYLADLTDQGLTQGMIDTLESDAQSMEDEMNNIADKEALRDIKTQERITKGNELYGFVTQYCEIGKIIWQDVDEAKYNDYVIYHPAPGKPYKVQNLSYDEPSTTFTWDPANLADTYELQFRVNTTPEMWSPAYLGSNTEAVFNPGPGNWIFRCRGVNSEGGGTWSDDLNVIISV